MDLGFERAGIETVLQAEQEPWALEVLARHWPGVERVTDVRSVGDANITHGEERPAGAGGDVIHSGWGVSPAVDLIYGGFPCQDVSVAGKRAGLDGERSGLWFEFHRIVRELRPRWVVIENVPGLLSSNGGADFAVILSGLDELGFDAAWAVLDSQHFGVPQRRRRVFVVAGPRGRGAEQVLSLCESCGGNPETGRAAGEGTTGASARGADQSGGVAAFDPVNVTSRLNRTRVEPGLPSPTLHSRGMSIAVRTAQTGSNGWGIGTEEQAYTLDGAQGQAVISPAVTSKWAKGTGGPSGDEAQNLTLATAGVRRLTPRECERLQGFPDDWTRWTADGREISDSHRYRMMGNAVTTTVAQWLGHRLMEVDA